MCADIFGGTQIPAWLVAATHEDSGGLGKSIGTVIAGGLLGLQRNEDGDGIKGFEQGIAEARMNQQDPAWKVREKTMEANLVSKWTQNATQWQALDATNRDMAIWTTKDLPAISKFQEELKTNPDAVPPVVESGKGLQVISQLEKQQMALQGMRLKQDNAKINLENQKTSIAFDQSVSSAPVTIGAAIDELPNQGWNLDRQGKRTTPSTAALKIYNDWATGNGQTPEKAFGYKPNAAEIARIRGDEQRKAEVKKGDIKASFEDKRQQDRKDLEEVKQKYRVDIEKMKLNSFAIGKGGKIVSEDEFVNRQIGRLMEAMLKDSSVPPVQVFSDADRALRARYRVDHKAVAATTTPAPAASTNAAPADAKDPLGLFSK